MATFVLVHGAWHGAWCWDRLIPELRARGHDAIATQYPCDDGTATFDTYADAVVASIPDDLAAPILVGHSLGGMVIPLVAQRRPVAGLVFVCGVVPKIGGVPWEDGPPMERPGVLEALVANGDGSTHWPTVESATAAFYADCAPEDAVWAFERLRPQNSSSLWKEPYPLEAWPDVPVAAIAGSEDPIVTLQWSVHAARTRYGVEPVVLPGGHSPFLARPAELANALSQAL